MQTSAQEDPEVTEAAYRHVSELRAALQAAEADLRKKGKAVRFEGVDVPAPRAKPGPSSRKVTNPPEEIVSPQVQASSSKGKAPAKPSSYPTTAPAASSSSASKPAQPQEKRNTTSTSTTQYKYQFPLEDPTASSRVFDTMCKTPITLPFQDILSIAPDVRKQLREQTTTKRVAVDYVAMNELSGCDPRDIWGDFEGTLDRMEDGTIVARHSMPLRCITATVNRTRELTCVLDQGAEIIAMRKDVWQSLGVPARSDHIMTMESANRTKNATLGVIENLIFDFGCGEMMLQVQVVEKANFDILIGRPFFAYTSCKTQDYMNGDQNLTISNLNSGKQFMIATKPWTKACPRCKQGMECTLHPHSSEKDF
jgi:hypothetical protein